jgi:hypothetical protein
MFKVINKVKRFEAKDRDIVCQEISDRDFTTLSHMIEAARKIDRFGCVLLWQQLEDC